MSRKFFPLHKRIDGVAASQAEGSHFSSNQGEHWYFHHRIFSSIEGQMFVVQIEGGKWLADSTAYFDEPLYDTREDALKAAAKNVAERCTWAARDWGQMSVEQANAITAWAFGIANEPPPAPLTHPPPPEKTGQLGLFDSAVQS